MASIEKSPNINLYTTQTPNGIKISITLEELGFAPFVSSEPHTLSSRHILPAFPESPLIALPPSQHPLQTPQNRHISKHPKRALFPRHQPQRTHPRPHRYIHRWPNNPSLRIRKHNAISSRTIRQRRPQDLLPSWLARELRSQQLAFLPKRRRRSHARTSKPFLPLRTREDRVRHRSVPKRDPPPVRRARQTSRQLLIRVPSRQ